jgi:hypothetical protein
MSRPPLPIGSWGEISTWVAQTDDKDKPVKYKSQAKFRDHDGHVRAVSAYGKTKTAAERAVLKKLQDRAKTNRSGELTTMHKIIHLLDLWEKRFEGLVADGKRSPTSLDTYRRSLRNHIRPALGELRIGEATTPRLDTVLTKIKTRAGAPTAKTCRAILSGAMKLAVRYGAISVNPVREVDAIEAPAKNPLPSAQLRGSHPPPQEPRRRRTRHPSQPARPDHVHARHRRTHRRSSPTPSAATATRPTPAALSAPPSPPSAIPPAATLASACEHSAAKPA